MDKCAGLNISGILIQVKLCSYYVSQNTLIVVSFIESIKLSHYTYLQKN